jgi:hypothetical protein
MQELIKKHGGKRENAGRKKTLKVANKNIAIDAITYNFLLENSKKNNLNLKDMFKKIVNYWLTNQNK